MIWLRLINTKIYQYIGIALAMVVTVFSIRRSGKLAERNANLEQTSRAIEQSHEIKNKVDSMDPNAVTDELHKNWIRH